MSWAVEKTAEALGWLRISGRAIWLVAGAVAALFGLYLAIRVSWFTVAFLERTIFSHPW